MSSVSVSCLHFYPFHWALPRDYSCARRTCESFRLVSRHRFIIRPTLAPALLFARSRHSGSSPLCDGGIPCCSSINFQVDNHFLEFCAIGLAHLVLHKRFRTLIPYLVVQNALRVSHILD